MTADRYKANSTMIKRIAKINIKDFALQAIQARKKLHILTNTNPERQDFDRAQFGRGSRPEPNI